MPCQPSRGSSVRPSVKSLQMSSCVHEGVCALVRDEGGSPGAPLLSFPSL